MNGSKTFFYFGTPFSVHLEMGGNGLNALQLTSRATEFFYPSAVSTSHIARSLPVGTFKREHFS
jgi:hypothetical protein